MRLLPFALLCIGYTISVSTIRHSDPSPANPNIAIDEERKLLGESKLKELERQSESSQCWRDAISQLDASCKDLTDMQQSRLAVAFANCHLAKSSRQIYPCSEWMTIEECTRDMDPVAFHTYTEFFTHAGHICYFLQSQLWQERTENVISRLSDSSKEALDKLEESLEYHKVLDAKQNKALNNQDKILDQDQKIAESLHKTSEQMNEAFTDIRVMAEKQRQLLSEVFGTLQRSIESVHYLMSLFLIEFVGYETFAFFIVYWLVILLLPRFGYSRAKLHLVLFADLAVEIVFRRIYGYFMFGEIKPPPETLNTLHSWLWNFRYLSLIAGAAVYALELRSHLNSEQKNAKNLEKLQRRMERLMKHWGIETREELDDVYGGPPVPPPRSGNRGDPGRRASDGMLAHQLPPLVVEPTPPRRSLPAGRVVSGQMSLTGSQAGGFSAAYPLQLQQHPDLMMGGPSHQPDIISNSSKMRIDSDGEFDPAVTEEVDSCVETDGGARRHLFRSRRERDRSRESSKQPDITRRQEFLETIEGPSLSVSRDNDVHVTSAIRCYTSRPPAPMHSFDTTDTDDLVDTSTTIQFISDSDTETFVPSDDSMVRQPIRARGATSSPASMKVKSHYYDVVTSNQSKRKTDPKTASAGRGGRRRGRSPGRRSQLDEGDLSNLPSSNLPDTWGSEKEVSEEKHISSDNESPVRSAVGRPPSTTGRGRKGRGQRERSGKSRRSDPVTSTTSLHADGHDETSGMSSTGASSRRRTTMTPATPHGRYNLRTRTPLQRASLKE